VGAKIRMSGLSGAKNHAICHCEERSDEAIQGDYIMNKPWIASPASKDAGSQ
jgi:hypothetical protein